MENIGNYPVILTCLADDQAVQAFCQIQPYLKPGKSLLISPAYRFNQQLNNWRNLPSNKGVIWIDSPVSGGTIGAEQGTLVIFAGGDAETIQQLESRLSGTYHSVSPVWAIQGLDRQPKFVINHRCSKQHPDC